MFKLVVLSALLAVAASKPHVALLTSPLLATATSYQTRTDIINKPVVEVKNVLPLVEIKQEEPKKEEVKPIELHAPILTYNAPLAWSYALTKNLHYTEKDLLAGYAHHIYKPDSTAFAAPVLNLAPIQHGLELKAPLYAYASPYYYYAHGAQPLYVEQKPAQSVVTEEVEKKPME